MTAGVIAGMSEGDDMVGPGGDPEGVLVFVVDAAPAGRVVHFVQEAVVPPLMVGVTEVMAVSLVRVWVLGV